MDCHLHFPPRASADWTKSRTFALAFRLAPSAEPAMRRERKPCHSIDSLSSDRHDRGTVTSKRIQRQLGQL